MVGRNDADGRKWPNLCLYAPGEWGDVDALTALYPLISFPFALFDFLYHEFVVTGPLNPEQRCSSVQRLLRIRSCDDSQCSGLLRKMSTANVASGQLFPGVSIYPTVRHSACSSSAARSARLHAFEQKRLRHVLALW